jgi:hypothetical protein
VLVFQQKREIGRIAKELKQRENFGGEVRDTFFLGGGVGEWEKEHHIVRRFPGSARSSF